MEVRSLSISMASAASFSRSISSFFSRSSGDGVGLAEFDLENSPAEFASAAEELAAPERGKPLSLEDGYRTSGLEEPDLASDLAAASDKTPLVSDPAP